MKKGLLIGILFVVIGSFAFYRGDTVDFNTEVRPILNQKCLVCHGGVRKNGGLSLRFESEALKGGESGRPAIVPGKPYKSELINRIKSQDHEVRMPLEADPLSSEEIQILERWIKQGAKWETHWAYIKPDSNIKPPNVESDWPTNAIDHFVYARLKSQNMTPSPEADKANLLRRVSLDLIGLPPSPEELEEYLEDKRPDAYAHLVDRLLSSPHFGEKWAAMWLDLARYADSQGYQKDLIRPDIWRYRDWVIDALGRDMPFDQFTIEQLAGDLKQEPSEDQILATAFHRNTMTNDEGGTDDEEFRVAAVLDRVNTTFEVWQASTVACVQCHSHPYDPFQHEEYYQLYSFFNNTADSDRTNERPIRSLLSPHQRVVKSALEKDLAKYRDDGLLHSTEYVDALRQYSEVKAGDIPVMQELPADSSRRTFVFERGNWLMHGQEVNPTTPSFLPPMDNEGKRNRLALARWLVSPENPLTARVIVNRYWEQIFGLGIVETTEDFGTQGSPPSHPHLLDWLAVDLQNEGWSIKRLLRKIVMSSTYRQSSQSSEELNERDPYNRQLARGPRVRLSAEQIRDQALSVSKLLSKKIYGPSVMPFQPEGVWNVIRHTSKWTQSKGDDKYRRGVYTFWRRVSPYPSMEMFDSPSRELCTSRRIRTNTPLQALVLLNDPVYTEAAQSLALRMSEISNPEIKDQIAYGYKLLMMKDIDDNRLSELVRFYNQTLSDYQKDPEYTVGSGRDDEPPRASMAAMTNLASVLLNLDEVIMKG